MENGSKAKGEWAVLESSSLDGERIQPQLPETVLVDLVGVAAADALEEAIQNSVK